MWEACQIWGTRCGFGGQEEWKRFVVEVACRSTVTNVLRKRIPNIDSSYWKTTRTKTWIPENVCVGCGNCWVCLFSDNTWRNHKCWQWSPVFTPASWQGNIHLIISDFLAVGLWATFALRQVVVWPATLKRKEVKIWYIWSPTEVSHLAVVVGLSTDDLKDF